MSDKAIKVENLSKAYQIGQIGTGTISRDLERFWATKIMGKEDPFLKIGETNDRSTKGFSDIVWSLKDINFEINHGDAVGIIGKNGAGKSTLLKLLSRVTSPTNGSIKVKGRIASLLEVGTGFHPELSGRENIFLNGAILGMRKHEIARKLDEIIDFSGVERYIDTPVKRYSSGMYVRLAFAVAAHLESEILIVDEVLAVGDAEFQKKCLGKMGDITKGEGRTVLFVSHNMAAVKSLCNTGIVLENGKTIFNGNADEAVSYYLSKQSAFSNFLISERTDRVGNGNFKFQNIRFFDKNGFQVSELISGEGIKIELDYIIKDYFDASKIIFSLIFRDNLKQIITSFISDEIFNSLNIINLKGTVVLEIPKLILRNELYEVMLLSFTEDTSHENTLDIIEDVCYINVLAGDLTGSGKVTRKGFSSISEGKYSNF